MIEIEITNDMVPEKDECFEIEILDPTQGAKLGKTNHFIIIVLIILFHSFNNFIF